MPRLGKRCIFCGEPPQDKTLEHVIPLWLIKHTGDAKRVVFHGMHFGNAPSEMRPKLFAFDQYKFPSCRACNEHWGVLEVRAKKTIQCLENEIAVTSQDLSGLLDWFDKVRVGIWLSRQMDRSSIARIEAKFHIDQRVGASDRLLYISWGSEEKALTTIGVGGAIFAFMPSVFAMRINGLMMFNASSAGLFGHRLGFPKLSDKKVRSGNGIGYAFHVDAGCEGLRTPVVQQNYPLPALKIYQPMYRYLNNHPRFQHYYRTDYVLDHSLEWSVGEGAIFTSDVGGTRKVDQVGPEDYGHGHIFAGKHLLPKVDRAVASWQRRISKSGVRGDINTPERRRQYNQTLERARRIDDRLWKAAISRKAKGR